MKEKNAYVYIMTNKRNTVLYIGVTNNLIKRVYEHKKGFVDGFTKRYRCHKLIYYEIFDSIEEAIRKEKYLKGKKRDYKINLINKMNPEWNDLFNMII